MACILSSALVALFYRRYLRSRELIILLPYLFLVFIQETSIIVLDRLHYISSSAEVYNVYRPISAMVFAYIYVRIPFMKSLRTLIISITALYVLASVIVSAFIESIHVNNIYIVLARGIVISFMAILFLFRFFNLDNASDEKFWRPLLWITGGLIIFYPVVSISIAFQKFLHDQKATLSTLKLYQLIPQIMSIFMYSCFSYAFYLCHRIKQRSLS